MAKNNTRKVERQVTKQAEALQKQALKDDLLKDFVLAERRKAEAERFLESVKSAETDPAKKAELLLVAKEDIVKATGKMKAARKAWNDDFSNVMFKKNLEDYKARVGTGMAAAEIIASGGTTEEKVAALRGVVESSTETRNVVAILQNLNDANLSPANLTASDGTKRDRAIQIVFPIDEANGLIRNLSLPATSLEHQNALAEVQLKHDELKPVYDKSVDLIGDLNEFDEQRETQKAKELLGRLGETFAEKPLETSVAVLAVIGTLIAGIAIFTKKDGIARKILMGTAIGGAALFGINFLSGALSKDGKTVAQRLLYDADTWSLDNISSQFKDELSGLTGGNEHAFQAMMHLKDAKASTLASAFENSLSGDPGQRKIDPLTFFSTREIPRSEARKINARGLYEGLEALMIKVAIDSGESRSGDRDYLAKKGLELFKQKYASGGDDIRLQYIICDSILGVDMPERSMRNNDGSLTAGGIASLEERAVRTPESADLQNVFDSFSVDMDVAHDGQNYRFMGYPLDVEVTKAGETNLYSISDPLDTGFGTVVLRKDSDHTANANKIKEHVAGKVKEAFADKETGSYEIAYDVDKHRWFVTGDVMQKELSKNLGHITKLDLEGKVAVVLGERGFVQIRIDGLDNNYPSVDKAVEAMRDKSVHDIIEREANYLVGKTHFEVKGIEYETASAGANATAATVEIEYSGSTAKFKFENGDITEIFDFEYNDAVMRTLHDVAKTQADNAMKNKYVEKHFRQLSRSFTDKFNFANFGDYINDIMEKGGSRMADLSPFFYDREGDWDEAVQLKKEEYKIVLESKILGILKQSPPPTPAEYEAKLKTALQEAYNEIGELGDLATEITGLKLDGDELNAELLERTEFVGEFGYKSDMFKGKMADIEDLMRQATLDWKGSDGMRTARRIRDHIRLQIFKKAMPIPAKTDAEVVADPMYEDYMNVLIAELTKGLPDALADARGNIRIPFTNITIDERIDSASINAVLAAVPSWEEYAGNPTNYYRAGALPTHAPVAPSSGASSGPGGRPRAFSEKTERVLQKIERESDLSKKMDMADAEIARLYEPIDDLEWSIFADNFDEYLGYRKKLLSQSFRKGVTVNTDIDKLTTDAILIAEREVEELKSHKVSETTDDAEALTGVMEDMTAFMVEGTMWTKPSQKVLRWLTGNFEFEKVAFRDKPTAFTKMMDIYLNKIGFGEATNPPSPFLFTNEKMAEEYTNYFLYSASKLLPGDKNWSFDNFSQIKRQVSETEWQNLVNGLNNIDTYEQWIVKESKDRIRPELIENDTTLRIRKGVEQEKAEKREEFMKWFEKNMDPSSLKRIDGSWPDMFKEHAAERMMLQINTAADTSEELEKYIISYKAFLEVEKEFYEYLIKDNIDDTERSESFQIFSILAPVIPFLGTGTHAILPDIPTLGINKGPENHRKVRDIIQKAFDNAFVSKMLIKPPVVATEADLRAFVAELNTQLKPFIEEAGERDARMLSVGPFNLSSFEGVDPFQITP